MTIRRTDGGPRRQAAIDRWLAQEARLLERHEVDVAAEPGRALEAALELPLAELPAVRALFRLRGIHFRASMTMREFFSTPPFVALEEEPGREAVFGIVAGSWGRGAPVPSPAAFRPTASRSGMAAVANLRADAAAGGAVLSTETWVETRGRTARLAFALYWFAVGPFSAWIRRMMLAAAKGNAEARAI